MTAHDDVPKMTVAKLRDALAEAEHVSAVAAHRAARAAQLSRWATQENQLVRAQCTAQEARRAAFLKAQAEAEAGEQQGGGQEETPAAAAAATCVCDGATGDSCACTVGASTS